MNIKYIFAIVVGLALQNAFIGHAVAGTNWSTITGIWIRDGGVDMKVNVDVPNATPGGYAIDYPNGDDTDPNNIHTTKTNYFNHLWMSDLSWSMWGTAYDPRDHSNHPVNTTTIRAYFDNAYGTLDSGYGNTENGPSVASNCHGYSMGYNTWVEDNSYIVANDFTNASGWSDCTELINGNDHSVAVSGYDQDGPWDGIFLYGFYTSEKNQTSDIYTNFWFNGTGYSTHVPSNAMTQLKHNK